LTHSSHAHGGVNLEYVSNVLWQTTGTEKQKLRRKLKNRGKYSNLLVGRLALSPFDVAEK
jgi:hypothetical protein